MEKVCSICKVCKPLNQYHASNTASDGKHSHCKDCRKSRRGPAIYKPRSEEQKVKAKAYYQENVEQRRAYARNWDAENEGYRKTYNQAYYAIPKKRALMLWQKAKRRHIGDDFIPLIRVEFAITLGVCERTGIPFNFDPPGKYHRHPFGPSIDKINPFGQYTMDNVQIVCNAYNIAKQQMTNDEFVEFCVKVIEADSKRKQLKGDAS